MSTGLFVLECRNLRVAFGVSAARGFILVEQKAVAVYERILTANPSSLVYITYMRFARRALVSECAVCAMWLLGPFDGCCRWACGGGYCPCDQATKYDQGAVAGAC